LSSSRAPRGAEDAREVNGVNGNQRAGIALAIMLGAQLMIILDMTVVNIALPHIQTSLHFSATSLSWVLSGYTLTSGGLLLLGGRAGDILGRRRMFIVGISLFTLASLAGGLANTPGVLLAARALQGVGGAFASPAVLALIVTSFPEGRERTRALGIYMGVITGGSSLGLVLGGVITEWLSWRWVLFINVPIGLAVVAITPRFVAETPRLPGRFDRDQIRHLQLVGHAEQHSAMMLFDPCRRKRGPRGILRGNLELPLVFLLGIEPAPDVFHEARFGERLVKERFQFGGDCQAVDRAGLLLGDAADRLLLNEPALQCVDRRQAVVFGLEGAQVAGNPE